MLICISQAHRDLSLAPSFRMAISMLESHTDSWPSGAFLALASFASQTQSIGILFGILDVGIVLRAKRRDL